MLIHLANTKAGNFSLTIEPGDFVKDLKLKFESKNGMRVQH